MFLGNGTLLTIDFLFINKLSCSLLSNPTIPICQLLLLSALLLTPSEPSETSIFHGSRQDKIIALTFDACPSSVRGGFDKAIVSILTDSCVPATFFLSGKWITRHRQETRKPASVKWFELGNHSYTHPHCKAISHDSLLIELQKTESLLQALAGTSPKLFRPPYGETDSSIEHSAQSIGITTVMFDLASGDPDSAISGKQLARYVISRARNGSIVVMHVNGRG